MKRVRKAQVMLKGIAGPTQRVPPSTSILSRFASCSLVVTGVVASSAAREAAGKGAIADPASIRVTKARRESSVEKHGGDFCAGLAHPITAILF